MYEGGGEASGSSGFVTDRMRRCEEASAALACAAADGAEFEFEFVGEVWV